MLCYNISLWYLIMMEKIPHIPYVNVLLHLKFGGFSIGYGIGKKYRPIKVSVSVSDQNQNSGFGRSLCNSGRVRVKKVPYVTFLDSIPSAHNSQHKLGWKGRKK